MIKETRTFTVTTTPEIMKTLERFLALLHFNSGYGHSGLFGMWYDGDGSQKIDIQHIDKRLGNEVDAIGGVGYDIEIAHPNFYNGKFTNDEKKSRYYTGPAANLYKDGKVVRTIPSEDYEYVEVKSLTKPENNSGYPDGKPLIK